VALRLPKQNYHDIERIIEFDFVRATCFSAEGETINRHTVKRDG